MYELTGKHFSVDLCLLKLVICSVSKCLESTIQLTFPSRTTVICGHMMSAEVK